MVHIHQLNFGYSKAQTLFNQLDLTLVPGNIYGLLGKNGAGKTSLLRIIAGMLFPRKGTCKINGQEAGRRLPSVLQDLYFLPEEYHLPAIHIKTYVDLNAPFYGRFDRGKLKALLQEFELKDSDKLSRLSYGQKKKFLLAFGLSTNASLLLFDEPTNGLDIPSKSQFRKVIAASVQDNQVLLISTHQVRDLESLIDPIIIIEGGRIIFERSMEEIGKKLRFETRQEAGRCLYAEEVLGGQAVILPNLEEKAGRTDLELLFNGVIAQPREINQVFENA